MRALKWWLVAFGAIGLAAVALGAYFFFTAPERLVRGAIEYERRLAGLERKVISPPGGLRFVYLEGGRGAPLLLLHGFGANKDSFVRVAKYLTPHYRVVIPDLAGFGESAKPPQADYAPRAQAERLRAFAHALNLGQLHLGGNSMGGHIALTYAALYPKEVHSLWLLDAGGVWSAPPSELRKLMADKGQNPLLVRNEEDFAQLIALVTAKPPMIPRPLLDVLAQPRIHNYALEQRIFKQIAADSAEERIRGLAVPALIVWGQQDRVIHPGTAGILQMLLIRSEVVMMPGVGHVPMLEEPEKCALDYLRFRATL
jgi:pimeloyl-ACP methyl ester carboxylesterase